MPPLQQKLILTLLHAACCRAVPAGAALPSPAGGLDLTRDDDDDAARLVEDLGASQPDAAAAAGTAWEATCLVWGW